MDAVATVTRPLPSARYIPTTVTHLMIAMSEYKTKKLSSFMNSKWDFKHTIKHAIYLYQAYIITRYLIIMNFIMEAFILEEKCKSSRKYYDDVK